MSKLPLEVKEKWLTALRSGEYEQTTQSLKNDGRYCCLGVLTDILLDRINGEWVVHPSGICSLQSKDMDNELGDYEDQFLPLSVCKLTGTEHDIEVKLEPEHTENFIPRLRVTLSELNDAGLTFE
jgi:hypothetical protein